MGQELTPVFFKRYEGLLWPVGVPRREQPPTKVVSSLVLSILAGKFHPDIWARMARASAAGSAASVIGRPTTM